MKYQTFFYLTEGLHCTCIFRTCVFRTCVFHPCEMRCFVLAFSVLAFSSTCVFSAPTNDPGPDTKRNNSDPKLEFLCINNTQLLATGEISTQQMICHV